MDNYTPSWARESTEPLQPGAPRTYTGSSGWATDASERTSDSDLDPGDGGRHHRPDMSAQPATESGRPERRRVAPEVTWDSTGEYWRGPSGAAADAPGGESAGDHWRGTGDPVGWRSEASGSTWRDTTGSTPRDTTGSAPRDTTGSALRDTTGSSWRDTTGSAARDAAGGMRDETAEPRATGRRGRRRAAADRHRDEVDDWASAAPTSGWVGAAPTTGAGAGTPTRGWISEAPTSGGWAAAAPTTGAGANSGLLGDPPARSGTGRRRRADPDDDPTPGSTSGWGVGATGSPSTATGRRDPTDSTVGWRGRTDDSASGRWGGAAEREPDPAYDPALPAQGRRRRAEPARWESDDPGDPVAPVGRRRSRHRAEEEPTQLTERPDVTPSTEPDPGTDQSTAGARWVRSPGQTESGGGSSRRWRGENPLPGSAGTGARRRQREPDAEPVRRYRDAGPVRRAGEERADRGRHADSGPGPRSDAAGAGWGTDAGPWDRFTDTGMLERVTDGDPPGAVGTPGATGTGRRRDRNTDPGRWDRSTDAGQWDRSTDTGQWDRSTDTGQWDRFTDTTEWRHGELAGLARDAGSGRDTAADSGARGRERTESDGGDAFWSGTRLAGDDPRWMGIPDSAPRSPAVAYPPPARPVSPARRASQPSPPTGRPAAAPGRGRTAGRAGTPGSARSVSGAGTTTRRAPSGGLLTSATRTGRPSPLSRRLEDDLLDPRPSGPLTAVLYTVAWYAVAVLAVFVWVLTLDASVPVDCVPGVSGACESERGQAISALLAGVPRFLAALATGLVVAALMRWFNRTWRAVTVGFAAAVVGGGLSTVFFSAISGQPVG
ncbi:hypothetical protein [Plantactinospora sp. BB1]|uniref:hypothetical protein n=1 Tax=Plantactinospora sp. BB1 TaxID=2071627 RepID=UPI000D159463|nr:hypothetical protein [Plantactinospora sp. BB1]AVT40013.1 hypothetical protein C6W10_30250 [Plantactinospora sp. BB1]